MGVKHSRGVIYADVEPFLPRSWAELERMHARYQQEVFRRQAADPLCAFFLTFPVFRAVVTPTSRTLPAPDDWHDKERLLRAFAVLDRRRKKRVAAVDFFAGLALVTNGKKTAKVEFLFALLDNGGAKTLNPCEVMMTLSAAARGLVMFKAMPPVDEDSLRPLARRLLGELKEIPRASLVEKAQTDSEIVFFMNDLENVAVTTTDALLAQQCRMMKNLAGNSMQMCYAAINGQNSVEGRKRGSEPPSRAVHVKGVTRPSTEALNRRLQALLFPPIGSSVGESKPIRTNALHRVDEYTLQRLIRVVSEGSLELSRAEAVRILSSLYRDDLGFARHSDLMRVIKGWIMRSANGARSVWQAYAQAVSTWLQVVEKQWHRFHSWISFLERPHHTPSENEEPAVTSGGSDVNYVFKATFGENNPSFVKSESTLRIRVHAHQPESFSLTASETDAGDHDEIQGLSIAIELKMCSKTSADEDAIDLTYNIEQFFNDESIGSQVAFAVQRCYATVTESQVARSDINTAPRSLRVEFLLKTNLFEAFEDTTGCKISRLVRALHASIDIRESIETLVASSQAVVDLFPELVKHDVRVKLLTDIFCEFDANKDGVWSLQEFNSFQQALRRSALDDSQFLQCFGNRREIRLADLVDSYKDCSTEDFRRLLLSTGRGSLASQVQGTITINATLDEREIHRLESKLTHLRWGSAFAKWLCFVGRSMVDASCDMQCSTFSQFLQAIGVSSELDEKANSSLFLAQWIDFLGHFLSPKHDEHPRDFVCKSILCSIEDELVKTPQQLEMEDQQRNLPKGTCARRVESLRKAYKAISSVRDHIDGIERVSIEGPQLCMACEVENFDVLALLRQLAR